MVNLHRHEVVKIKTEQRGQFSRRIQYKVKGTDFEFLKIGSSMFAKKTEYDNYLIANSNFTDFLNFSR